MRAFLARGYRFAVGLRLSEVSKFVSRERLTYLPPQKLRSLERLIAAIDADRIDGGVIECGVALGGSAIVLAKLSGRRFDGYDVFGMMPAPSPRDPVTVHARYAQVTGGQAQGIGGDVYYGYRGDLLLAVERAFTAAGIPVGEEVSLHVGPFAATLHPDWPIALAHIDCDRHDPVAECLPRIWAVLSSGGYVILDDYTGAGGCRQAADDFLAAHPDAELIRTRPHGIIQKRAVR